MNNQILVNKEGKPMNLEEAKQYANTKVKDLFPEVGGKAPDSAAPPPPASKTQD